MSIQFGGLSSNLPVNDIITKLMELERRPIELLEQKKAKINAQQTQYTALGDRLSKLAAALKKMTTTSVLDEDLFKSKKPSSSNENIVSATVTTEATAQSFTIQTSKLATSTKATSIGGVGALITTATPLSQISQNRMTAGAFKIYVNGTESTINVDPATQTVNDVLAQVRTALQAADPTANAAVGADGKIQLTFAGGTNVQLGSNSDTTNFLTLTRLSTGVANATSITSSSVISTLNPDADMSDNTAARLQTAINAGSTFTIGSATFDTTGKSLNTIIGEINASSTAGVTATFNAVTNKLELVSKSTGNLLIDMQDVGGGNFLAAMGLISGGDETLSQTAGQNAEFKLNGTTLYSNSNTVTADVTGLTGVTLTLKSEANTLETITVAKDNDKLKNAMNDFIVQFNTVMTFIDEQTNAEGKKPLANESGIIRLKAQLRQQVSDAVSGLTKYNSLSTIGISTGAVTGAAAASPRLLMDEATFNAAMADNADEVKAMAVGADGIITKLKALIDNALHDDTDNSKDGLIPGYSNSVAARIKDIDTAIERNERRLEAREKQLRQQFALMDKLISQYNSQSSAIAGLSAQLNGGK